MMLITSSPRAALPEIWRNRYQIVRYDEAHRLVVLARTPEPYADVEALRDTFRHMELSIARVTKRRAALLIDSRRASARNDAEFEVAFAPLRRQLIWDFRKVGILVQTAVGALQVKRHAKIDGVPVGVFTDPGEALAYLDVFMPPALLNDPG